MYGIFAMKRINRVKENHDYGETIMEKNWRRNIGVDSGS